MAKTTRKDADTLSLMIHQNGPLTHSLVYPRMAEEAGNLVLTMTAGPQTHYTGSDFLQQKEHPQSVTSM